MVSDILSTLEEIGVLQTVFESKTDGSPRKLSHSKKTTQLFICKTVPALDGVVSVRAPK